MILPILLGLAKELKDLYFDLRHHDEDDSLVDILGGTDNIDSTAVLTINGFRAALSAP
jgi:hypothetical protein